MSILILDVSSKACGWAVMDLPERLLDFGVVAPKRNRAVDRIDAIVGAVGSFLAERTRAGARVELIVMEWCGGKVAGNIARRLSKGKRKQLPPGIAEAVRAAGIGDDGDGGGDGTVAMMSGLSVLGAAQGAVRERCRAMGWTPVLVTENEWTRRKPKPERASNVEAIFPRYRSFAAEGKDSGRDAADAIGLGLWYMDHRLRPAMGGA